MTVHASLMLVTSSNLSRIKISTAPLSRLPTPPSSKVAEVRRGVGTAVRDPVVRTTNRAVGVHTARIRRGTRSATRLGSAAPGARRCLRPVQVVVVKVTGTKIDGENLEKVQQVVDRRGAVTAPTVDKIEARTVAVSEVPIEAGIIITIGAIDTVQTTTKVTIK